MMALRAVTVVLCRWLAAITAAACLNATATAGEIVFANGVVLTMDEADARAEAVLVRDEVIVAVGDKESVLAKAGPDSIRVDLGGKVLLPGFIDTHQHRLLRYGEVGLASPDAVIAEALTEGWTSLDELYVDESHLELLRGLDSEERLRLRVNAYLTANDVEGRPFGNWYSSFHQGQTFGPRLRVAGLKIFVDSDWGRDVFWSEADLGSFVSAAEQDGWRLAIKSIGSQTLELILKAFEHADRTGASSENRRRIEHALSITSAQAERMRRSNAIASIQTSMPGELIGDPEFDAFVAREPKGAVTPWRSLLRAGVVAANGSAWPSYHVDEPEGAPFGSPLRLIYQAVTRAGNLGTPPEAWMLDETISVDEALRSLTADAAFATFEEDSKGRIAPGLLADLVVLSDDPRAVRPEEIPSIQVQMTMVGGRVEWCAPEQTGLCPEGRASAQAGSLVVPPGEPVRIALAGPESGPHGVFLPLVREAVGIAIEDYGAVHGFAIELASFDDECSADGGLAAARRVVEHGGFAAVLGPLCSNAAEAALRPFEEAGIVVVSPSATGPGLAGSAWTIFNRVMLDDNQLAAAGPQVSDVDRLPGVDHFYDRLRKRTGGSAADEYRPFLPYGYDATKILLRALDAVGVVQPDGSLQIDRPALADAVRGTSGFVGLTGTITLDENGNRRP